MGGSGGFCPFCGTTNPSGYRFCGTCQHEIPRGLGGPLRHRRARRRAALVATGMGAGVAVALAVLFLVPVSTPFDLSVTSSYRSDPATVSEAFPAGAHVSVTWNTTDDGSVTFSLVSPGGEVLQSTSGSHGSLSFVSSGGVYGFRSSSLLYEVVDVRGTYVAPLLP